MNICSIWHAVAHSICRRACGGMHLVCASGISAFSGSVRYTRGHEPIKWCIAHWRPVLPLAAAANAAVHAGKKTKRNDTSKALAKISSWIICLVANKQRALQVQNPATVSCSQPSQQRWNMQTRQKNKTINCLHCSYRRYTFVSGKVSSLDCCGDVHTCTTMLTQASARA